MKNLFKKIIFWIYLKIHLIIVNISISLYNTEIDILKADPNDLKETDKKDTRKLHRNQLLEKFYIGNRDEKYVKDYYEILKKADKFIQKATPLQMAVAADKHGTNYGMKDHYGRRYEHYGFFDDKHKNAGKTLGEVITAEYEDRRTKDDEYEILHIFNNKPIEVGLTNIMDVIEKTTDDNYQVVDHVKKSKNFEFPIKANHLNQNIVNKIEQLSEFLHVKKIGFEYRQLEFFIPLKYKTIEISEDSEIFKDITDITEIYINDDYGQLMGYGSIAYLKRITYNNTHEIFKFEAREMESLGQN